MTDLDRQEFLERAARAWRVRVPRDVEIAAREWLDGHRAKVRRDVYSARAEIREAFLAWILPDRQIAVATVRKLAQSSDGFASICRITATYVFARERVSAIRTWRCPAIGGTADKDLDDSCLIHLVVPRPLRSKRRRS